jgi:hypothetical protein
MPMIMLLSHHSFHNMKSPVRVMCLFMKMLKIAVMELSVSNAGILESLAGLMMPKLELSALFKNVCVDHYHQEVYDVHDKS